MSNFYFEVNPTKKQILSEPKILGTNWKTISGILYLTKDELYDLSWAGYPDFGFIKISNENKDILKNFNCDLNTFSDIKLKYKEIVSNNRNEQELHPLTIDNRFSIQLTDKCKLHLTMKCNECLFRKNFRFNWKTSSGCIDFTSENFLFLYRKIQIHIQTLFDLEIDLHRKIDACTNVESLFDLNLNELKDYGISYDIKLSEK